MQKRYQIAACSGQAIEVKAGDKITIIDVEGQQVVDFFAVHAFDFEECLSTGVTIDCNASLKLRIGDTIYTNRYRPMFKLMQDDVGEHDLLHPCCREQMYEFFYGSAPGHSNCLDAINDCLRPYGVVKRDLIHPVNFFMHTQIRASR